jgi:hypothetical protein
MPRAVPILVGAVAAATRRRGDGQTFNARQNGPTCAREKRPSRNSLQRVLFGLAFWLAPTNFGSRQRSSVLRPASLDQRLTADR